MSILNYRKAARKLNLRKRFYALSSNEKQEANIWRKFAMLILILLVKYKKRNNSTKKRILGKLYRLVMMKYIITVVDFGIVVSRPERLNRNINSFNESQCWNFFETRKEDLSRLLHFLKFDRICILTNGSSMCGEEIFLRGMYELVSGENQNSIAENVFGREFTQQSRAFKFFVDHIYNNFHYLLCDNLQWWFDQGFIMESLEAINRKLVSLGLNSNTRNVFGFIDCNCLETCRVLGGPSEEGPNAARWDDNIQRAFYNGWKSIHGLKHQTVDIAHGLTIDMYGPTSLRRNDLKLLGDSEINQRLNSLGCGTLTVYGDSIYPKLSNVTSSWRNPVNTPTQILENSKFKSIRISIEWNYMVTSNLFSYLKKIGKLKLMESSNVAKIYTVATLLRNCHVCLYGGICSDYFDIALPHNMLEKYFRLE